MQSPIKKRPRNDNGQVMDKRSLRAKKKARKLRVYGLSAGRSDGT